MLWFGHSSGRYPASKAFIGIATWRGTGLGLVARSEIVVQRRPRPAMADP